MSEFFGASGICELRPRRHYDPRYGWTNVIRGRGTPTEIESYVTSVAVPAKLKFSTEPEGDDGGYEIISIDVTADAVDTTTLPNEALTTTWLPSTNELEKDLWECPVVRTEMDKLQQSNADTARVVRHIIEDYLDGENTYTHSNGTSLSLTLSNITDYINLNGLNGDVFSGFIHNKLRGVEVFPVSQFVLQKIEIISARSQYRASRLNVNKHFQNTAELVAFESIPTSDLVFELPEGLWVKLEPRYEEFQADKLRCTSEWIVADGLSTLIYPRAAVS
jgi:hypothetical protein